MAAHGVCHVHCLRLQVFDTLIGDADQIYDLSTMDDQLVLGIKGTLSVVELKVLRQRLIAGRENKVQRGAYFTIVPPGYVVQDRQRVVKDPNKCGKHGQLPQQPSQTVWVAAG